jgi:hypothetical protein
VENLAKGDGFMSWPGHDDTSYSFVEWRPRFRWTWKRLLRWMKDIHVRVFHGPNRDRKLDVKEN